MESTGKELLPRSFFMLEYMKETFRTADLTLVMNRHGSADDAERSVEIVEPGSAVFIEGFTSTPGVETDLQYTLKGLSAALCIHGVASSEYQAAKHAALEMLAAQALEPAHSYSDFHTHKCREVTLLVEKDCFVTFADYDQSGIRKEDVSTRSIRNESFQRLHEYSDTNPLLDYGETTHNIAKTIRGMHRAEKSWYLMHFQRENFAINSYLDNLTLINNSPKGHELTHTSEGKLKASI